jgi:hypothetical protein
MPAADMLQTVCGRHTPETSAAGMPQKYLRQACLKNTYGRHASKKFERHKKYVPSQTTI